MANVVISVNFTICRSSQKRHEENFLGVALSPFNFNDAEHYVRLLPFVAFMEMAFLVDKVTKFSSIFYKYFCVFYAPKLRYFLFVVQRKSNDKLKTIGSF